MDTIPKSESESKPFNQAEYMKGYRQKNREKSRIYMREYKIKHPEKFKLYRKNRYERDRELELANNRLWRKKNPQKHALKEMRRRAMKRKAPGHCTLEQLQGRIAVFGGKCWLRLEGCTLVATTIDHVIPLSRGGTNWPSNLRPACKHCNSSKGPRKVKLLFSSSAFISPHRHLVCTFCTSHSISTKNHGRQEGCP